MNLDELTQLTGSRTGCGMTAEVFSEPDFGVPHQITRLAYEVRLSANGESVWIGEGQLDTACRLLQECLEEIKQQEPYVNPMYPHLSGHFSDWLENG